MAKDDWLKKYTELKYLEGILKFQSLHLGDPACWDDKNDSAVLKNYAEKEKISAVRSTCLTNAPDRFHFWSIFGKEELGVCLWFDRELLKKDIENDKSLIASLVEYPKMKELELKKPELKKIPFLKREQYRDEGEYRIVRVYKDDPPPNDGFKFSANSLKRIYLNAWLNENEVKDQNSKINELLGVEYKHVDLKQNRVLRKKNWIDAVCGKGASEH